MSLKLGLYRNKHKLCCSEFCQDLPAHSHSENTMKNQLLDNLLRRQLTHVLLERERDFKRIYFATFERCREQTARSHANRNRFKLGHHLGLGQKILYENHRQDLSKSQKLQQRRLGSFTVTKRITSTTYQIQDDQYPTIVKTVHRNHLVEYFPKEESLPAMIEEHIPSDKRHDDFYERFMERRIQKLNDPNPVVRNDSIPFPIALLPSSTTAVTTKRISKTSVDSGVNSPLILSPSQPSANVDASQRTPTPIPSTFRPMPASHFFNRPLTPIQQIINNSRPSRNRDAGHKELKYNRSQPDHPDTQSVLRTRTH